MGDKSNIEWTEATWTPIRARNKQTGRVGWFCTHDTTGCELCYAENLNLRLGTKLPFKPGHLKDVDLFLDEEMLLQPLRWKRPRMIFVCSMTDLFASFVPDEWIDKIFAVMALAPQHTYQVLTKRAKRMHDYMNGVDFDDEPGMAGPEVRSALIEGTAQSIYAQRNPGDDPSLWLAVHLPLKNVWLGVSTERQREADLRIPFLMRTPAALRFVSAEPLISDVEFSPWVAHSDNPYDPRMVFSETPVADGIDIEQVTLDWIIVGGESKQRRAPRPFEINWARRIIEQCRDTNTKVFVKQLGGRPIEQGRPLFDFDQDTDKNGKPEYWPEDIRVREMPKVAA